ncbi:response regulator [bacterium]|nr:response regulator [bacterium]
MKNKGYNRSSTGHESQIEPAPIILIVEDDEGLNQLINKNLQRAGFFTESVLNASDAIARAAEDRDMIMLLDYALADITCREVIETLTERRRMVPFIIMTGRGDEKTAVEMMKLGARDYIVKDQDFIGILPRVVKRVAGELDKEKRLFMAEEALRQSDARYRELFDAMKSGVVVLDSVDDGKDFVFKEFNRGGENIEKVKREDVIGMSVTEIFPGAKEFGIFDVFQRVWRTGKPEFFPAAIYKDRRNPGSWRENYVYKLPSGEIVAVYNDITERKLAEEKVEKAYKDLKETHARLMESQAQLIQSEKLRTAGMMAAGIAHELNNPLMGIINFAQYCLKHTSGDDRRHPILQDIEQETKKCIDIVQGLLTLSHMKQEGEKTYTNGSCATVIDRALKLLAYRIDMEDVTVTFHIEGEIPEIWMETSEIQQVCLNLLSNSLDALKDSGRKKIDIGIRRSVEFVEITIADTGCGISPENMQKIFDPFFTTKPVGQGTGLGLSVSRSIIEEHGGNISCESEPDIETRFKVLLPIKRKGEGI